MIGPPSSGTTSSMSDHNGGENVVRLKRRTFEDLDVGNICEEICNNAKKRNTLERDPLEMALADIVHDESPASSSFSSSSSSSSLSSSLSLSSSPRSMCQFPLVESSLEKIANASGGGAALARLEVLVVDGSWDVTNFNESGLIDLSTSATDETSAEHLTNIDSSVNGYSTVLSYWESPSPQQAIESCVDQCKNVLENSEPSQSTVPLVSAVTLNDQQDDHEHGNLSWLLDFKLDSLIEAPEEKTNISCPCHNQTVTKNRQQHSTRTDNINPHVNTSPASCGPNNYQDTIISREKQLNSTYRLSDNRNYSMSHYNGPKKPPFTYTELIEHALQERGELTVSAIYQWISEHFPYYKSNDDRWKNSVRHNLSINPHFRKGSKAPHGAGHLWAIANRNETRPRQLIANIPGLSTTTQSTSIVNPTLEKNNAEKYSNTIRQSVAVDEVAIATASISDTAEENVLTSVTLEHCAEQILSGIKREVEVQYLLPMAAQDSCELESSQQIDQNERTCDDKDTERECWNVLADFLNPVAKEVVAEECGLIGEGYLVTDLNPTTLGLNIVEPEIITSDHLFGEELSFQFYELASPSQLQSA